MSFTSGEMEKTVPLFHCQSRNNQIINKKVEWKKMEKEDKINKLKKKQEESICYAKWK